jgi:putative ABC transport system substrate-binding protein
MSAFAGCGHAVYQAMCEKCNSCREHMQQLHNRTWPYSMISSAATNRAFYVDRILRGSSPAELPMQAPTKYQTVLNLKTAKALDLTVPAGTAPA